MTAFTPFEGKIRLTGTVSEGSAAVLAQWQAAAAKHRELEVDRMLEMSRLTGMEAVYDLRMFDIPWSPVYRWPQREPIGWANNIPGERSSGASHPDHRSS